MHASEGSAADFVDPQTGWVVTNAGSPYALGGRILHTSDSGKTWVTPLR